MGEVIRFPIERRTEEGSFVGHEFYAGICEQTRLHDMQTQDLAGCLARGAGRQAPYALESPAVLQLLPLRRGAVTLGDILEHLSVHKTVSDSVLALYNIQMLKAFPDCLQIGFRLRNSTVIDRFCEQKGIQGWREALVRDADSLVANHGDQAVNPLAVFLLPIGR